MNKNKLVKTAGLVALITLVVSGMVWFGICFTMSRTVKDHRAAKLIMLQPTLPVPTANASSSEIVFVPRVIDGDTIVVEPVDPATGEPGKQETIRYIGMDTPETVSPTKPVECYGHEASDQNKALVLGKYVAIARDAGDKDKYGRLLRFVYLLDGTFINLDLVKNGYARVFTVPPNTEFEPDFKAAAASAKAAGLGFWGACKEYPFNG